MDAVNYKRMVPRDVTGRVRYPHEVSRRERWMVGAVTTGFEVVFTGVHYKGHPTNPVTPNTAQEAPLAQLIIPTGGSGDGVGSLLGMSGNCVTVIGDIENGSSSRGSYTKSDPALPTLASAFTDGKDTWTMTGAITRPDSRDLLTLTFTSTYYPGKSWTTADWNGGAASFEGAKELWLGMLDPRVMATAAVDGWYVGVNAVLWGYPGAKILSVSVS